MTDATERVRATAAQLREGLRRADEMMAAERATYRLGKEDGPVVIVMDRHATTKGVVCRCQTVTPGVWLGQRWDAGTIPIPHPKEGDMVEDGRALAAVEAAMGRDG